MSVVRLHVLVEGQTEEGFVNRILRPELARKNVFADAHRITTGRRHGRTDRGGFVDYRHLAQDLTMWMKQDQNPDSWFTTMVDLYRLPATLPGGVGAGNEKDPVARVCRLESALRDDVRRLLERLPVSDRFIPYVQLHEFEALLFSEPRAFREAFPGNEALVQAVTDIRSRFATPEHIDDGPQTAPSKRIVDLVRSYQKTVAGLLIAERIGVATLRTACPHFHDWVSALESLPNA